MGLVYDKYCYVSGSPYNLLILQKYTQVQRFVCCIHLNATNIQLSLIVTSEIVYCDITPEITLVALGFGNVNSVSYALCLLLENVPVAFRHLKLTPALSCLIYILTSFEGHSVLRRRLLGATERGRFCFLSMASLLKFSHLSNRKTKARACCYLWILVVVQKCWERTGKC